MASQSRQDDEVALNAAEYYKDSVLPGESQENLKVLSNYNLNTLQDVFEGMDSDQEDNDIPRPGQAAVGLYPWLEEDTTGNQKKNDSFSQYRNQADLDHTGSDETPDGQVQPLPPLQPGVGEREQEVIWIEVPSALYKASTLEPLVHLIRRILALNHDSWGEPMLSLMDFSKKKRALGFMRLPPTPTSHLDEVDKLEFGKINISFEPERDGEAGTSKEGCHKEWFPQVIFRKEAVPGGNPPVIIAPAKLQVPSTSLQETSQTASHTDHSNKRYVTDSNMASEIYSQSPSNSELSSNQESKLWDESEEEDDNYDGPDEFVFMCPIKGSDSMSEKTFHCSDVKPFLDKGLSPPQLFRAVLKRVGALDVMEEVLDIAQTFMP